MPRHCIIGIEKKPKKKGIIYAVFILFSGDQNVYKSRMDFLGLENMDQIEETKLRKDFPLDFIDCDKSHIDQVIAQHTATKTIEPSPLLTLLSLSGVDEIGSTIDWLPAKPNKLTSPLPPIFIEDWGDTFLSKTVYPLPNNPVKPLDRCIWKLKQYKSDIFYNLKMRNKSFQVPNTICDEWGFRVEYRLEVPLKQKKLREKGGSQWDYSDEYDEYKIYNRNDRPKTIQSVDWEQIGKVIESEVKLSPKEAKLAYIRMKSLTIDRYDPLLAYYTLIWEDPPSLPKVEALTKQLVTEIDQDTEIVLADLKEREDVEKENKQYRKEKGIPEPIKHIFRKPTSETEIKEVSRSRTQKVAEVYTEVKNALAGKYDKKYMEIIREKCP